MSLTNLTNSIKISSEPVDFHLSCLQATSHHTVPHIVPNSPVLRKPTRDITVNIFSARFFFISARLFFISARLFFISARFVLFPQGYIISARFILFPQGYFYFPEVSSFIFSIWVSPMPISLHYCSKRAITPNDLGLPVPWWLPLKIFSRKLK